MGFFSSSKSSAGNDDGHRTRWFSSKSSSKSHTASTSDLRSVNSSYQHQAPSRPAPPHAAASGRSHPAVPQLLPARDVRSFHAEPSGSGGGRAGVVDLSDAGGGRTITSSSRKGKAREDDSTVLLANRLNELAVSNADGLLGDDEYRILRQEVFEQMSAARTQARKETRNGSAMSDAMNDRETLRTPTPGQHPDRPPSTHSSHSGMSRLSNLGSLFSKKSANNLRHRDSLLSGTAGTSVRSSRMMGNGDGSSLFSHQPSHRTSIHSFARTSQDQGQPQRHRQSSTEGGLNLSIRSGRTGYSSAQSTADQSRPGSIFSTSTRNGSIGSQPPSAFSLRSLQPAGSIDGLPGADAKPVEIREEMSSVEAEGKRLLAVFEGLRQKAIVEHGGEGGSSSSIPSTVFESPASDAGEWTMINHSPSLGSIKKATTTTTTTTGPPLKPALKKTSHSTSPSIVSNGGASSHLKGKDSMSSLPASLQRWGTSNGQSERSMLPPAFRPPTSSDPDQAALQARLADIDRRKKDVQERYDRRLEFLRGKLRAAEIREKALR